MSATRQHDCRCITLKSEAIGWLYFPEDRHSQYGALLFHGTHRLGSQQASAKVLVRALQEAGYIVFAIDHPGYGESPVPIEWDPTPTRFAAFEYLKNFSSIKHILAVGHSMGAIDVLHLLQTKKELIAGVLFGASLRDPPNRDPYWNKRFLKDRGLPTKSLSLEEFLVIRDSFYDPAYYAKNLPLDHAPVVFVRFGKEHNNIVKRRDKLYALIPGKKSVWDFTISSHQFNSSQPASLLIGDEKIHHELVQVFSNFY